MKVVLWSRHQKLLATILMKQVVTGSNTLVWEKVWR